MSIDDVVEIVNLVKDYNMGEINNRIEHLEWLCMATDDTELHKELRLLKEFRSANEIFNSMKWEE